MPWPVSHRADSLEIDFFYLQRRLGDYLGFDRNAALWDDEKNQIVQEIIDEGTRAAYFPDQILPPFSQRQDDLHEWSFMRPTLEFETVSGQRRYELPPDFERPVGPIAYNETSNNYDSIPFTSPSRLRILEGRVSDTSNPDWAAVDDRPSTGVGPQRRFLILHPTPDSNYKMALQYQANGRRLTSDNPYPLGGQAFGTVILASCMAAAELRTTGQRGPLHLEFQNKLASAVLRDGQRGAQNLGYSMKQNLPMIGRGELRERGLIWMNPVTFSSD